jgi:electron transport complex protein RnfC
VQYYRYAKSEIIAADKAQEAADLARERNEFRLARIEREKFERAQKHAERAASGKAEAGKVDAVQTEETKINSTQAEAAKPTAAPVADDAKKAAIAAAVERAKALKAAAAKTETTPTGTKEILPEIASAANKPADDEQAKKDKQALIAAAIERAKAQKLAATHAGLAPKNVENISPALQAEISEIDAIREKAKQAVETKDSD